MNNLSEQAKDDIQNLIERSKNNLDDLISSKQSEADIEDSPEKRSKTSFLSRQGDFLTIPEDDKEDNPDSNRHDSDPDKIAADLLGDMLTDNFGITPDKESDKNS